MEASREDWQKVAIIGTSGSGKTCFIAAMRWLGDGGGNPKFISVGANGDSKKYLDDLDSKIKVGKVPQGTPNEFKLEFSEQYAFCQRQNPVQINFSMRDFKGGLLHDLDSSSDLLQSWTHCDLLMVLLDVEKIQKQGVGLHDNLRDLSSVLIRDEMCAPEKRLAIVVTQADKGKFTKEQHSPTDAEKFIDEHLSDFFERVKKCGFKELKCFALASIGSQPEKCDEGGLQVIEVDGKREWHPFGYEEIFDWICAFRRLDKRDEFLVKLWKRAKPVVAALAILAIAIVIWLGVVASSRQAAVSTYENQNSSLEEKAAATWRMWESDCVRLVEERIIDYKNRSESVPIDELQDLKVEINTFFKLTDTGGDKGAKTSEEQRRRVVEIEHDTIATRLEEALFEQIKVAIENHDSESARNLIRKYQEDFEISKTHQYEVNEYQRKIVDDERTKEKLKIAGCDVHDTKNQASMKDKLEKILAYNYPTAEEEAEAKRAVDAMKILMRGTFKISRINAGTLKKTPNTRVMIAVRVAPNKDLKELLDEGQGVPLETDRVDSKEPQWSGDSLGQYREITWAPGDSIRVEWRWDEWWTASSVLAFYVSIDDWVGMLKILQPQLEMCDDSKALLEPNFATDRPTITIVCDEFKDPKKDLELIEKYVYPGTYWIVSEQNNVN